MKAPHFSLSDQNGKTHSSEEYAGKWLVVYFYPKDDTPGCTVESCSFRDSYESLLKNNIHIIGISRDSTKSHAKFATKFELPFPLLSDPDHSTIEAFGAWGEKKFMGKVYDGILRKTYIIDPSGEIVKTYDTVKPAGHADEVYADIQSLQNSS